MLLADKKIKNQAIIREHEASIRRKRESKFTHGHGHAIIGSIHDCSRKAFEKALTNYWDKLYVGWNPYKKDGKGCWEVWARPSRKTKVHWGWVKNGDFTTFKGSLSIKEEYEHLTAKVKSWEKVFSSEYVPNDFEHWVADLDYLSYNFIGKLRSMDAWENKDMVAKHDAAYDEHFLKLEQQEDDNIRQIVKENKKAFRDLLDYTQSGINPLEFFAKKF